MNTCLDARTVSGLLHHSSSSSTSSLAPSSTAPSASFPSNRPELSSSTSTRPRLPKIPPAHVRSEFSYSHQNWGQNSGGSAPLLSGTQCSLTMLQNHVRSTATAASSQLHQLPRLLVCPEAAHLPVDPFSCSTPTGGASPSQAILIYS
ncbi:unnamed protein product [Musa acuminata var. zebrina]